MHVELAGETMTLLPGRAMHWPRRSTLLIADPHFGKGAAFRHAGIPVPAPAMSADLMRLDALVTQLCCERLIILGDFFHARTGLSAATLRELGAWFSKHAHMRVELVSGNHDVHAGRPPDDWGLRVHDELFIDEPFACMHDPAASSAMRKRAGGRFVLGGHIHPAVIVRDRAGGRAKLPCFHLARHYAVLPAFAGFTGGQVVRPSATDRLCAVAGDSVIEIAQPDRISR